MITDQDLINAKIEYGGRNITNKEITQNILNEWRNSERIAIMKDADMYALVKNTGIDGKTRNYEDEDGYLIENKHLSNVKTKTGQYRKSLLQKLDFTLSKPFVLSCDNDNYKQAWTNFLKNNQRAMIRLTAKDAINKGIGWIYVWIDSNGELQLMSVDSKTIYPAWKDVTHTELDAVVRDYVVIEYINQTPSKVYKVEYWDKEIVEKFIDYSLGEGNGGALVPDTEEQELKEGNERVSETHTHMEDADGNGVSWNKVPFIYLKGNDDELSLLEQCKEDIDTYDMTKSKGIDSILDDIDAVLVVEGISAEMGELARARKLVQNSRIMAVDTGGSAHFEKVNSDITAISQQLDIIKKDIQDNTNTVDVTTIALGSNPSGKAMRTFYEPLNTWTNGFEAEFRVFFEQLKYFFDMWLSMKGGYGSFEELQAIDITVTLDRDMLIDEDQIITNIVTLGDEISQETRLELNPYVDDVQKELKRLEQDKEKQKQEMEEYTQLENDVNNQNLADEDEEEVVEEK